MKNNNLKINVVIVSQPFAFAKYDLLGRTAFEHLLNAFKNTPLMVVDCVKDIKLQIKYDYLAVVYANMPLLTESFLQKVALTMRQKQINKVNLGKGYMASSGTKLTDESKYNLNMPETLSINDAESLNIVYNILKDRIIQKHLKAGVVILDSFSTVIDDTAIIESGVIIEPFCKINKNATIKANTVVKSFTSI